MTRPIVLTQDALRFIQNRVFCSKPDCSAVDGKFLSCWHEIMAFARHVEISSLVANGHDPKAIHLPDDES